jgi:predicted permease
MDYNASNTNRHKLMAMGKPIKAAKGGEMKKSAAKASTGAKADRQGRALLPILFLMVAKWLTGSRELQEVLLLQAAMPAATFPIVMTRLYNRSIETALTVVVGTSVLGIITIPIWMVIGAQWLDL